MKPTKVQAPSNLAVRTVPESAAPPAGTPAEEAEWIARAQAGDAAAFRCLVERYGDRVYGLALRMLGSPPDAEEVAQDAFLRAWRALPRFRGDSTFSTWLHRIAVRRALDRSETLKARRSRETDLEAAERVEAPEGGTGAGARDDTARRIERLLDSLSDAQRAVVVLYYYEDRSVEQVAHALGIPVGTVKTHLHRARAILRAGWMAESRNQGDV